MSFIGIGLKKAQSSRCPPVDFALLTTILNILVAFKELLKCPPNQKSLRPIMPLAYSPRHFSRSLSRLSLLAPPPSSSLVRSSLSRKSSYSHAPSQVHLCCTSRASMNAT